MIFRRSIVSELTSTASAVFTVLFSIIFSVGLVRILGQAAGGRVDNQAVFELLEEERGRDGALLYEKRLNGEVPDLRF